MPSFKTLSLTLALSLLIMPATVAARDYYAGGVQNNILDAFAKLTPKHTLSCISPEQISNQYTPIDLTKAGVACFTENKPANGFFLFQLANLEMQFDEDRIFGNSDNIWPVLFRTLRRILQLDGQPPAAEDILVILKTGGFETLTEEQQQKYFAAQAEAKKNNDLICEQLERVGMPTYHPEYLLENRNRKKLASDFKPKRTWSDLLQPYCGEKNKKAAMAAERMPCLTLNQVNSKTTPAQLYPSALQCFREQKFEQGTFLFVLARMYIEFDKSRVKNKELAKIIFYQLTDRSYSKLNTIGNDSDAKMHYVNALKNIFEDKQQAVCRTIKSIGMPTYFPDYIKDEDEPRVSLVFFPDLKTAWEKSFNTYCYNLEELKA